MESITKNVEELIKNYSTNCPFKIANELGIEILYESLGNTLGYFNIFCRIKMIHINEDTSEFQKKFICAHELGHSILHPDVNTPFLKKNTLFSTERIEQEANFFAIKLLFSDSDFFGEELTVDCVSELNYIPKLIVSKVFNERILDNGYL